MQRTIKDIKTFGFFIENTVPILKILTYRVKGQKNHQELKAQTKAEWRGKLVFMSKFKAHFFFFFQIWLNVFVFTK